MTQDSLTAKDVGLDPPKARRMEDADAKLKKGGGRLCCICNQRRAALKRPKTLEQVTLLFSLYPLFVSR